MCSLSGWAPASEGCDAEIEKKQFKKEKFYLDVQIIAGAFPVTINR